MAKVKQAKKKQSSRAKKVEAKAAPKPKPQPRNLRSKAAKENAEVGSGPVVTSKDEKGPNFRKRRKAGMNKWKTSTYRRLGRFLL